MVGHTPRVRSLHILASADRRGAEVFGAELATALSTAGHETEVVALTPSRSATGLDVEVLEALRRPAALVELSRRARGHAAVVGHGSHGLLAGTLVTVAARRPFVYRSIGDPSFWGSSLARRLRIGVQLRRAAGVVSLWDGAAATIVERYGVAPSRMHVVPNAVTTAGLCPADEVERKEARAALGLDPAAPLVAYVGALSPEKRVGSVLEAVAVVPDLSLVVAGDGPDRAAISAMAERLLPGRCAVLGALGDVTPVLRAADVLILMSETEGQPAVAMEAGLSGIPVVATNVGGLASVVADGHTGYLIDRRADPADAAAALVMAIAGRDTLGANAFERCTAEFTMSAVQPRWDALLRAVSQR